MNLQWSAITLAGHVSLILSVILILRNAILARRSVLRDMPLAGLSPLIEPVVFFLTALVVERAYYVAARAMVNRGINLWEAHPSPSVLAFGLAATALWVAIAALRIAIVDGPHFRRLATAQVAFIVAVFCALSWGLW